MKRFKKRITPVILMMFAVSFSGLGRAAGDLPDTFVAMPVRVVSVNGDVAKFRALNWMNDGVTGGIKELGIERKVGKDTHVSFEGHALPGDKDLGGTLTVTKDNVGYYKVDYGTFRKWYDNVGGNYPLYTTQTSFKLENSDIHLDMGHFLFEVGKGAMEDPDLSLTYERDTKTGVKSRLSWGAVTDAVTAGGAKRIAPSSETMDETTDTLTLRAKAQALGFTLKGLGSYEFFDATNSRDLSQRSNTNSSTTGYNYSTFSQPQTKLLTTNVLADRWSLNDKTYVSTGYHFSHNNSTEIFNLRTRTALGVLVGGSTSSSPYNDGYAQSLEDKHAWTGQLMSNLTDDLNFTTKGKVEIVSRRSSGTYFDDSSTTPFDGAWNYLNYPEVENKITRTGESVGLRYNGVPKTSLYTELDMEQEGNWITEAENKTQASSSGVAASREEIARNSDIITTAGIRFVPTSKLNMTSQYKHSYMGQTFNTLYKNPTTALNYNSIFNKINTDNDELASKISWKPFTWLENSAKYKVANHVYHTNAQTEDWEKAQMSERDYIYDLTLIPTDSLMFNLSYSVQDLKASTRESQITDNGIYSGNVGIPVFTANVYTWMFSTSYAPKENLSFFNTLEFSRAKNVNDSNSVYSNVRYGADDQWWDSTIGIRWSPKKDITVEPHYAYYSFTANQSIETGNYSAHVMWLDVKYNW